MKKLYTLSLHIGYWLTYCMLIALLYLATQANSTSGPSISTISLLIGVYIITPSVLSFYGSYFFIFKLFIQKTKHERLILFALSLVLLSTLIAMFNIYFFIHSFSSSVSIEIGIISFLLNSFNSLFGFILHSFISWFTDLKDKEKLTEKTKKLELEMLKLKLDPHFLFNTINNIDVLIETNAEKASEYILKLSSILRFYLYKTSESSVFLEEELKYIQEYIDLQKIRTTNENFIILNILGKPANKKIPPMIFIPFIENAFKHSKNKKSDQICINVEIMDKIVQFTCTNTYENHDSEKIKGLGNTLIKDRLSVIFGDRYSLKVNTTETIYQVHLIIPV